MDRSFGIVDLFSGPGGLGEGFSSVTDDEGRPVFEIDVSIEAEASAHRTLLLRSFLRKAPGGYPEEYYDFLNGRAPMPDWSELMPAQWRAAAEEARLLRLGTPGCRTFLSDRIREIRRRRNGRTILIGGPPCQAYSVAGRGRAATNIGHVPSADSRHLLYREYIGVLEELKPVAFVMENVKGLLSSRDADTEIVRAILRDLRRGGRTSGSSKEAYRVFPISAADVPSFGRDPRPEDFLVEAERHGIPQTRHRVIFVGIRQDLCGDLEPRRLPRIETDPTAATVFDVIGGMPRLRGGLSARSGHRDVVEEWRRVVLESVGELRATGRLFEGRARQEFAAALDAAAASAVGEDLARGGGVGTGVGPRCPEELRRWLTDDRLDRLTLHDTRAHMPGDLARYLFASAWGRAMGTSPRARDFPDFLAPSHRNWTSGKYIDRFRVQIGDRPATTVTCHLSKDGHYFIHPDPSQVRSLTVREAARLQTFPDNYHFAGNRTEAYIQVGNAVPPYLARQIARALAPALADACGDTLRHATWAGPAKAVGA